MKVLYSFGEAVGSSTIMKEGIFYNDGGIMGIEGADGNRIRFSNFISVEGYCMNGELCYMIKIKSQTNTMIIAVPRIYIKIGTGFIVTNHFKTKKLKTMLESKITA